MKAGKNVCAPKKVSCPERILCRRLWLLVAAPRFTLALMQTKSILLAALSWAVAASLQAQSQLNIELTPKFTLTGSPGIYEVQWAQVLGGATNWVALTNVTLADAPMVFYDPTTASQARRFYRALCLTNFNPDPARMAWIPPGTFTMGSPTNEVDSDNDERPQTVVTLTRGFYMSKYETTQREYLAVMGTNPSYFPGDTNRPVEQVSWDDATNYCGRLTARERQAGRLTNGWVYRLPTEAEWEYACRAGTTTAFHYGNALRGWMANFNSYIEYDAAMGDIYVSNPASYLGRTTAVGSYQPNGFGLYDMQGNVWEWCQDWHGAYPGGSVTNPTGASSGSFRVLRGGSWSGSAGGCRAAYRCGVWPGLRRYDFGFRSVLAPGQP
jgi:formylglycine-generating enzyme required for sulfatase activity